MEKFVYRCPRKCPIGKDCFVLKTQTKLNESIVVLQKCPAEKKDIPIRIGGEHPP